MRMIRASDFTETGMDGSFLYSVVDCFLCQNAADGRHAPGCSFRTACHIAKCAPMGRSRSRKTSMRSCRAHSPSGHTGGELRDPGDGPQSFLGPISSNDILP